MKLDTTKIALIILILYIGWANFFKRGRNALPKPTIITVPKIEGTTGVINIEPQIIIDTVYIKGETIEVDRGYKKLYEKTKDSLARKELYLEAIKINNYSDTLVDNSDITIKGSATTRGSLLDYSIDYTIKKKDITHTPEVIRQLPRLSAGIGLELGLPTIPRNNFVLKANLSVMNKKGNTINISYDTEERAWVGYKKTFKIFK